MVILDGIKNFLTFVNQHWTTIVVIIGLLFAVWKKIKNFLNKSDEEKLKVAKGQIKEIILKLITDAECDYEDWEKAGSIKRSQVIEELFAEYPILSKAIDQEALIKWIDEAIDSALVTLREIVETNGNSVPHDTTV